MKELRGLVENRTFVLVEKEAVPTRAHVFGSRLIDEIKPAGQGFRPKRRLVAQNHCDKDAAHIVKKAPTVQRSSQRLVLCLASSIGGMTTFTRDVTKAYIHSATYL